MELAGEILSYGGLGVAIIVLLIILQKLWTRYTQREERIDKLAQDSLTSMQIISTAMDRLSDVMEARTFVNTKRKTNHEQQ